MKKEMECYLCGQAADLLEGNESFYKVDCGQCGSYRVSPGAAEDIAALEPHCRTGLCGKVRQWLKANPDAVINQDVVRAMSE
ncbi:hypothetical protein [Desulfohalovibrio reitneri]|uniref:hypothetical protein n=1 Tax=Desulfohalovibrio reitneri TaxID=1307759 RepID=UPI0004A6E02E|nr:hypothetical protein [Desulfohalovibrio reitneri]